MANYTLGRPQGIIQTIGVKDEPKMDFFFVRKPDVKFAQPVGLSEWFALKAAD